MMQRSFVLCLIVLLLPLTISRSVSGERRAEIRFKVVIKSAAVAALVRLYLPFPPSNEHQTVQLVDVEGNFSTQQLWTENQFGNTALVADWHKPSAEANVVLTLRVKRTEVRKQLGDLSGLLDNNFSPVVSPAEVELTGLNSDRDTLTLIAQALTKDLTTPAAKARAIYDFVVDNFQRDPSIVGCGIGDVRATLARRAGKCVDLHTVFVGLARAAGLPAREIMGIRIPHGKRGAMTDAYHCWAEVLLPGAGWFPVDPSDVIKIGFQRNLTPDELQSYRDYYFGAVDANRIAFGTGRRVVLNPKQNGPPLNYFMYPYAEVDGRPLDSLSQKELSYEVTFTELP